MYQGPSWPWKARDCELEPRDMAASSRFVPPLICLLFLAALGLDCHAWAFSSCGEQRVLSSCDTRASHCSGFSCCEVQTLGTWASVVEAHGL